MNLFELTKNINQHSVGFRERQIDFFCAIISTGRLDG